MKRIKKFVALALAATMMISSASSVFAAGKVAETNTKPTNTASTETLTIPMFKENGKWKIDPMYAFIGIKNIKWNSEIIDLNISKSKKIALDTTWKYAPYALLIKQKGTIVPRKASPSFSGQITADFWVFGPRQAIRYTKHIVTLEFEQRESPIESFYITGIGELADDEFFATTNSEKFYKLAKDAWKTIRVELKPYLKNLKLVAIRKDGRKEVIRSTSGRKFTCSYNLKDLKAFEIRYSIDRAALKAQGHRYYNYLKDGVTLPCTTGSLILNVK